ncbi:MAG: tRNA pseudouridine(55) synthase TruB [Bacteroidaceae bacterium]|nr:tRNA pseudouridine(55) synthase TruB [Prevotellaceae bacterium]MDY5631228.1 tRNA pseudouridine(55) synthase TruB [Bacteroidaceae bacterium]
MDYESGEILCFDKPLTWTSFNLVAKVRWALCRHLGVKKLKVGHAGTLDPLATGVLIVCTGKATKRIDELQAQTKEYVATLQLGSTTPSFDLEKDIDATYPTAHITRELIDQSLPRFMGRIEQVPPAFSAVKVDGKRAYKLARKGDHEEIEQLLKPKVLVIDELEVLGFDAEQMQLTIRVVCSKGTYIRALARDIGQALQSGAHLIALRRTRVGDVRVEQCRQLEDFITQIEKQTR